MSSTKLDLDSARKAIIGPSLQNLQTLVIKLAERDRHTLFVAETGAGKELFWNLFKAASTRKGPKLAVNCAGFTSESLLESRLFGHVKGAFTGATTDVTGILKACNAGLLFLDELGDSSEAFQVGLLRVREEQEFQAVGSTKAEKVDICLVAATSRESGIKRKDLKAAFQVVYIPSLKQREDDVPYLIQHFLQKQNDIKYISEGALFLLSHRDYPGNVRDLKQFIERSALIAASYGNTTITSDYLLVTEEERSHATLFRDWEGFKDQIPVEEIVQTLAEEEFKPFPIERFFEPFDNLEDHEPTRDRLERQGTDWILAAICEQLQRIGDAVARPTSAAPEDEDLESQESLMDLQGVLDLVADPKRLREQHPERLIKLLRYHIYETQLSVADGNISKAAQSAGVNRSSYDQTCRRLDLTPSGK